MILENKQTHITYRCPDCGDAIFGLVGAFSLRAEMVKLKCPCGKSSLHIQPTKDKKARLSVPCLFCGKPHHYMISQSLLYGRELFLLNCPYTNMDICFTGTKEKIDGALSQSAGELERLFASLDMEPMPAAARPYLPDASIHDIVRFVVRELEEEGKIYCPCQNGTYDLRLTQEGICVFCTACGASALFPADSVAAAEDFLHCEELHLAHTP
ncbi:MAG: hypothetical protein WDA00_01195 [Eubacteriales bacterium]